MARSRFAVAARTAFLAALLALVVVGAGCAPPASEVVLTDLQLPVSAAGTGSVDALLKGSGSAGVTGQSPTEHTVSIDSTDRATSAELNYDASIAVVLDNVPVSLAGTRTFSVIERLASAQLPARIDYTRHPADGTPVASRLSLSTSAMQPWQRAVVSDALSSP
jgi:hypothetical protein